MKKIGFALILTLSSSLTFSADLNRLYVSSAESTSYLQSNWNKYQENYHANYAFDDNTSTAWVEGVEGYGEQQSLEWQVSELMNADEVVLRIKNGYQKSASLFQANSAVKTAEVTLFGAKAGFVTVKEISLEHKMGEQEFKFTLPDNHGLTKIKMKIMTTYPGKVYKDTCLSDLQVWVKSKVPYNPKIEEGKKTELAQWIRERLKAAKFYANKPADYPFSQTVFRLSGQKDYYVKTEETESLEGVELFTGALPPTFPYKDLLSEADKILQHKATEKDKSWQKIVGQNKPFYAPDGLQEPYDAKIFYSLEGVSFFEISGMMQPAVTVSEIQRTSQKSNMKIEKENGKIKYVSYFDKVSGVERGPYAYESHVVMAFANDKIEWFIDESVGGDESGTWIWHFKHDAQGKINEIVKVSKGFDSQGGAAFTYHIYQPIKK